MFRFNPGKEQRTFPAHNPYTISKCRNCDKANDGMKLAKFIPDNKLCAACQIILAHKYENTGASERILKYDETVWERTYISSNDDGFVVTQLERIVESKSSKVEKIKFEKELHMCKVLANNGYDIEYLSGINRIVGQTYDITINNTKADLKSITGGAGNIVKYTKKALTKQGGEAVIFELPNSNKEYYIAMAEARRRYQGRIYFYIKGKDVLKEVK